MTRHTRHIISLFLLLLAALPAAWGQGEGWFTLTNGNLWFFDGEEGDTLSTGKDDPAYRYSTGFDVANTPISSLGTHAMHSTTHIVEQGSTI